MAPLETGVCSEDFPHVYILLDVVLHLCANVLLLMQCFLFWPQSAVLAGNHSVYIWPLRGCMSSFAQRLGLLFTRLLKHSRRLSATRRLFIIQTRRNIEVSVDRR